MSDLGRGDAPRGRSAAGLITVYRIVSRAYFHLPVVAVFLLARGYPILAVALLLALYGVVAALADGPLSPLTRRLSSAGALVVGEGVKALGLVVIVLDADPVAVVISQLLAGCGFSLTAGRDAALASSLRAGADARRQETRVQSGMFLASFGAGVLGAASLALWDRLPFLLSALVSCAALAVVLLARLPLGASAASGVAARAVRPAVLPAAVRFWSLYYSVNRAVLLAAYTFVIPLLLFQELRLTLPAFGLVLGLYTLAGLAAARLSPLIAGTPLVFRLTALTQVLGLALTTLGVLGAAIAGLALLGIAGGFVRPATMIALAPAMNGLEDGARVAVMRGLERNQGILQAVLLVGAGILVPLTGGTAPTLIVLVVLAVLAQTIGAVSMRRQERRAVTTEAE
ncbi:hypothetical protein C5D04_16095 [Rathayibacter sp. AY1D2]|uniref:hypothetical protein n=1 Tax=unclassified Rathayibacter TaxID=2609250 RepID=UPI000CE91BAB|nr:MULTISPECIES: hypothetical protein [unclassified Rathayibacter]PPF55892.1 hypothetical protein C5C55_09750 [Rathayibacter sp. AY1C2]PPG62559.1 hypothetical protein C5C69_05020 [Rathayibacter sp. AY1C7]PPI08448.1 hypothetical protein C5D04_16095 [Rathayibacter sp. AY1D2]PPI09399.1 hypothetical protein C5C63_00245 [Rathayibacter sp. AY1B8]